MFVGAVPRPAVEQITRVVPFDEWGQVFVGCSGSFRFDRAVKARHPSVDVHSNDISLLSCSLGALATGTEFPLKFKGRLAFIEEQLTSQPFVARVAAIEIALEMAKFKGDNPYAISHFAHYKEHFADFLVPTTARVTAFLAGLEIRSFFPGDFREQAKRAAEASGGIAAFAPTYKGGYERLYRFVDDNSEWPAPKYDIWDPAKIEDWMDELDRMKVRYCVLTDHELEHHEPVTVYRGVSNKPIFNFSDRARSSIRRASQGSEPFKYTPVDPDKLTPDTVVEIVSASSKQLNFLKDRFLAKGIAHVPGIANYIVFLDGCLAGGFIYAREKFGGDGIYLLSDFAINPKGRLSKLIAMLSTSHTVINRLEIKLVQRIGLVKTTAFTNKPVSMKYRGIFDLVTRKPGMLNYASQVRRQSPAAIYCEWFQRFVTNARHQSEAQGSEAAGEKRAVHEGPAVQ